MRITVQDLIDSLQEMDPDAEVRLAVQPSYPLEHALNGDLVAADGVVWLAEAGQLDYLAGHVAEELGWR